MSPALQTLKCAVNNDNEFNAFAQTLAEETKSDEKDPKFRLTMALICSLFLDVSKNELPEEDTNQKWSSDLAKITDANITTRGLVISLARAWLNMSESTKTQIVEVIKRIADEQASETEFEFVEYEECVDLMVKTDTDFEYVVKDPKLRRNAIRSINLWWRGQMSGARCCKNVLESTVLFATLIRGLTVGATIGSSMGPIGAVLGGVIGYHVYAIPAIFLLIFTNLFLQKVLGIPIEEVTENAYKYFGTTSSATDEEINSLYRKLCLKHHPDKGGNPEEFLLVKMHMAAIKADRGQLQ